MLFSPQSEFYGVTSVRVGVEDDSAIGEVRRQATVLATYQKFDETLRGKVAIVMTELARNLLQHAQRGEVLLRPLSRGGNPGLEILALDKGPGMADVARCLRDGYSTGGGTPGTGLGAVQRQASFFDLYSLPGRGTAVLAQFGPEAFFAPAAPQELITGVVSVPKAGEHVCGDAWGVSTLPGRAAIFMADGLGHGPYAAEASFLARNVFLENASHNPVDLVQRIHGALRPTRGAAGALLVVQKAERRLFFVGVGNISAMVSSPRGHQSFPSVNGTLGHEMRKSMEFSYAWPETGLLIMHSDGLTTHWDLTSYPGLSSRHPSLVAGILYRDFARGRDDVTVLVAR